MVILCPCKSHSKIYRTEPRYNNLRYNTCNGLSFFGVIYCNCCWHRSHINFPGWEKLTWLIKKKKFIKNRDFYLYSPVDKIVMFCEITKARKSVRIAQLTRESPWFVLCVLKVVRKTTFIPDALKTTLIFWPHINLLYHASVQFSSFFCLGKVNSLKTGRWNTACAVYSGHRKNDWQ